jgi:hypothetical protein
MPEPTSTPATSGLIQSLPAAPTLQWDEPDEVPAGASGVIAELVACKDLKDEESRLRQRRENFFGRNRAEVARLNAMRDDYNRRKPLAWKAARAWLAGQATPPVAPGLPIRGVRVDGDTVIVSVKGGNDAARFVCGALVEGMEKAQSLGQRLTQCTHCGLLEDPGARPCAIGASQCPVAAKVAPAPVVEHPDDLLTVANIEPENGGATLTLLAAGLGNLIDIVGEQPETYTVRIAAMTRVEFEALGEFDGF